MRDSLRQKERRPEKLGAAIESEAQN